MNTVKCYRCMKDISWSFYPSTYRRNERRGKDRLLNKSEAVKADIIYSLKERILKFKNRECIKKDKIRIYRVVRYLHKDCYDILIKDISLSYLPTKFCRYSKERIKKEIENEIKISGDTDFFNHRLFEGLLIVGSERYFNSYRFKKDGLTFKVAIIYRGKIIRQYFWYKKMPGENGLRYILTKGSK